MLSRQEPRMILESEILLFKMLVQWPAESVTAEWWDIGIMMNGSKYDEDRYIMAFILK